MHLNRDPTYRRESTLPASASSRTDKLLPSCPGHCLARDGLSCSCGGGDDDRRSSRAGWPAALVAKHPVVDRCADGRARSAGCDRGHGDGVKMGRKSPMNHARQQTQHSKVCAIIPSVATGRFQTPDSSCMCFVARLSSPCRLACLLSTGVSLCRCFRGPYRMPCLERATSSSVARCLFLFLVHSLSCPSLLLHLPTTTHACLASATQRRPPAHSHFIFLHTPPPAYM
jgi:hypothetical protein